MAEKNVAEHQKITTTKGFKMTIYAYIRVSSNIQMLEHQEFEIKKFTKAQNIKVDKWVEEKISSRKPLNKRQLGALLGKLKTGDTLITSEISRLGRSLLEVMHILETCLNKNCQVWTIKENYRLGNNIQSKVMAFAFGISAEIERQLISERTKAALENVKASGNLIIKLPRKCYSVIRLNKVSLFDFYLVTKSQVSI